jgi:hypothetical protein
VKHSLPLQQKYNKKRGWYIVSLWSKADTELPDDFEQVQLNGSGKKQTASMTTMALRKHNSRIEMSLRIIFVRCSNANCCLLAVHVWIRPLIVHLGAE